MNKAKLTDTVVVTCPHCDGDNEVDFASMGDKEFPCQFDMQCGKTFELPDFDEYSNMIAEQYL